MRWSPLRRVLLFKFSDNSQLMFLPRNLHSLWCSGRRPAQMTVVPNYPHWKFRSALPLVALIALQRLRENAKHATSTAKYDKPGRRKASIFGRRNVFITPNVKTSPRFWSQETRQPFQSKSCRTETSSPFPQHRHLAKCNGFTLLLILAGYSTRLLTQGFLTKLRTRWMPTGIYGRMFNETNYM